MKRIAFVLACFWTVAPAWLVSAQITSGQASAPAVAGPDCKALTDNSAPIAYELQAPTRSVAARMYDQLDYIRAVEMYLWSIPAVSLHHMRTADWPLFGGSDAYKVAYLGSLLKSNVRMLTGNPDSMYVSMTIDTHDGPVVLEIPPELPGFLDDMWQRPVVDLIPQVSPHGRYLVVPPGWTGVAPDGMVVVQPRTYASYLLLRGGVADDGSTNVAVEQMRRMQAYPLSRIGDASREPLQFFDRSDVRTDMIFPEGFKFFETLAAMTRGESPTMQEPYVMGMLASLGIATDKPFRPNDRMRHILECAAVTGQGIARTIAYHGPRHPDEYVWSDRKYRQPFIGGSPEFIDGGKALHDPRIFLFYLAWGTSQLMNSSTPGQGQAYPSPFQSADGALLDGGKTYRMHIPPGVPAKLYWSVTVYDNETRSELENATFSKISRFTGPQANADGSYDLYFGPSDMPGQERNFVKTIPGKGWFALFRLYGPEAAFFDGRWKPNDIVEIRGQRQ